jgi:hypothetical protein
MHSRSNAATNIASLCGSAITKNATLRSRPFTFTSACPKSTCASPGSCKSGTNTSRFFCSCSRTASFTAV